MGSHLSSWIGLCSKYEGCRPKMPWRSNLTAKKLIYWRTCWVIHIQHYSTHLFGALHCWHNRTTTAPVWLSGLTQALSLLILPVARRGGPFLPLILLPCVRRRKHMCGSVGHVGWDVQRYSTMSNQQKLFSPHLVDQSWRRWHHEMERGTGNIFPWKTQNGTFGVYNVIPGNGSIVYEIVFELKF